MNNYQLTVLVKNDLEEKARKELLDGITKRFGKMEKEDLWGNRDLAYQINHATKAYFAHYEFQSEPNTIADLDKTLKLDEDILRYLLLKVEKKAAKSKKK